jgi:AcrR family transcriptional regulator
MSTERQQEIIDTSLAIISELGIQGLTIKNLSKRIGISEPAIYRHYDNKISILIAILDYFGKSGDHMFSKLAASTDSPLQKIEAIFQEHFRAFQKNPSLVSVIFSEEIFRNEALLQEKIRAIMEKNSSIVMELVREGQRKGEIKSGFEAGYLTIIIIGSLRMMVKKWQMGDESFNHKEAVTKLFATIRNLISA